MYTLERLSQLTTTDLAALQTLVRELSTTAPIPDRAYTEGLLADPGIEVFVARHQEGQIVGCLVLSFAASLTGVRAHVDDVVVTAAHRGAGIGRALVNAAIDACGDQPELRSLDLTSSAHRTGARRLYQSVGFVCRDSQVFRHPLRSTPSREHEEVNA